MTRPDPSAPAQPQPVAPSFEEWCADLNKLGAREPDRYGPTPVESCGAESWRDYFDMGYSPLNAWREDGTYD